MATPLALIVEDDPDQADIFALALDNAGYHTEVITDGMKAISRLVNLIPDVVVLDLHLPNLSGRSILTYLKTSGRFEATQVILVSADSALVQTLAVNSDFVLLKPISPSQLQQLATRIRPVAP